MKVFKVKRLNLALPAIQEGKEICWRNPYILHAAEPEHSCQLEMEEVEMTEGEYHTHEDEYGDNNATP